MRWVSVRTLVSCACILPMLLGSVVSGPGYVLCVGTNGHVEVSSAGDECDGCERLGPEAEAETAPCPDETRVARSDGCCPCVDLQVFSGGEVLRGDSHRTALELTRSDFAMGPGSLFGIDRPRLSLRLVLHDPPDASRFVLPQLRSVILVV